MPRFIEALIAGKIDIYFTERLPIHKVLIIKLGFENTRGMCPRVLVAELIWF